MVSRNNIVFLGTPQFAAAHLNALIESGENVAGVVSRPDKPKGRGRKTSPTPVKEVALDNDIEIIQPYDPKSIETFEWIKNKDPWLLITVAYGRIVPANILDLPSRGAWNVHASLLPRWRGASPINRAIQYGDAETGVTLMVMDAGLDTGDILLQASTRIGENRTAGELEDDLKKIGCRLLLTCIERARDGDLEPRRQPGEGVTSAPPIEKAEMLIDWGRTAAELHNHIRAFSPKPAVRSGEIKLLGTRLVEGNVAGPPGSVKNMDRDGIIINTGEGLLKVIELQPPGKKPMGAADYARGKRLKPMDVLK